MTARAAHAEALRARPPAQWEEYLEQHSGLPGPRADLELLDVVGDLADAARLRAWSASPDEYLAACGTAGLGRLVTAVEDADAMTLRDRAGDGRWRVREGVAMALQRVGDRTPALLRDLLAAWADGDPLVLRAAAAGVCEPRLLRDPATVAAALDLLDVATSALAGLPSGRRRDDDVRTLRKGLGYCWSVAVAADPAAGFPRLERWLVDDPDVRWVVRQNLGKARLTRADAERAAHLADLLRATTP
ncbi:HEAT repeat domain-containing protein [Actinotalea sp. M2MS4P-6]|uniref:HEAT repeat domain-containing protein n=1 Tax=Actinotalea sp. M2MS4P-6 TaxID=2983762 RepID=UPI0021E476E7|nr:HEAT repeat domain-containing protein [Actinotalea sp. M2MS4P-6]MCV2394824.1 HEAT repeat domain-containing protein [Actinotalea sp. M2MS4P-6]